MLGTFSPPPQVSDPDMHHGTCVTHVPWCMPGSLTRGFLWIRRRGKTFPAFPAHAQPAILCFWQEAYIPGGFYSLLRSQELVNIKIFLYGSFHCREKRLSLQGKFPYREIKSLYWNAPKWVIHFTEIFAETHAIQIKCNFFQFPVTLWGHPKFKEKLNALASCVAIFWRDGLLRGRQMYYGITLPLIFTVRVPFQYLIRRLIPRSREVSRPSNWLFIYTHRFEIGQAVLLCGQSTFKAIRQYQIQILVLWDITRSCKRHRSSLKPPTIGYLTLPFCHTSACPVCLISVDAKQPRTVSSQHSYNQNENCMLWVRLCFELACVLLCFMLWWVFVFGDMCKIGISCPMYLYLPESNLSPYLSTEENDE